MRISSTNRPDGRHCLTLAPEGGQHQSVNTPLIGIAQDRLASFEPAHADELSILINRVEAKYTNYGGNEYPLVYFIAHIRMRDVNNFRTVQSAANRNGAGALKPWLIARRNNFRFGRHIRRLAHTAQCPAGEWR